MFQLGMIEGISRPAIASIWPTLRGQTVVLDVRRQCFSATAEQLVDFAVMGEAFAHVILGLDRPTVGILNVGAEEQKGNDAVKGAAEILRTATNDGCRWRSMALSKATISPKARSMLSSPTASPAISR